ncbi:TlpA family protein disulfide reductase, partial [bacterium]|nr:TlpA family protein disulfide reductase [bacterium]
MSDRGLSKDDKVMSKNDKGIDFTFNDLNDKPVKLSDYRGKIVLVDIWATWCPPCQAEIPGFINLYKKYKERGVEIIGVSVDRGGKKVVAQFAADYNINYTILMGEER